MQSYFFRPDRFYSKIFAKAFLTHFSPLQKGSPKAFDELIRHL